MFNNKEEAKILSDDEFERIGRRKKTIVSIIIIMIVLAVSIPVFRFIKKDNNINVKVPEVVNGNKAEEKTVDETVISEQEITEKLMMDNENKAKILPIGRKTEAGENEFICEYSEINLPELLQAGDYVDVRLSLADGRNYTVTSEKKIMDFNKSAEKSLIYLSLCEEEIIILESAIADLKLFEGSRLYLVLGKQKSKSKINYPVNKQADKLLHPKNKINNLSDYDYEVKFDKELEKERVSLRKAMYCKGQEWKEAASYWNDKE